MDTARLELTFPASRPPGGELLHVTYSVLGPPTLNYGELMPGGAKAIVCGRLTIRPSVLDVS
jgi:hypothetical protein